MGKNWEKASEADVVVGVCYRLPTQAEEADKIFYKHLGEVSQSLALVLGGDFNLPDVLWKYIIAERKQYRKFLDCVEDKFLKQLVRQQEMVPRQTFCRGWRLSWAQQSWINRF